MKDLDFFFQLELGMTLWPVSDLIKYLIKFQLGQEGLKLKVDNEYMVKVKFISKKFSSFGSYPKYMGIKLSENYTAANENTKQAYKVCIKWI